MVDFAGLPIKVALEQFDLLGEVLPTLRAEFDARPPTNILDASPYDWGSEGTNALGDRIDHATAELVSLLKGAGTGRGPSDDIDLFSDTFLSISNPPTVD